MKYRPRGHTGLEVSVLGGKKGVAIFNSAPLAMRLLSADGPPDWHPAPEEVRARCAEAARDCREHGGGLDKLALQFSAANANVPTHIVGTANPERILQNIREIEEPLAASLLAAVQAILAPIHNVTWPSGLPENN